MGDRTSAVLPTLIVLFVSVRSLVGLLEIATNFVSFLRDARRRSGDVARHKYDGAMWASHGQSLSWSGKKAKGQRLTSLGGRAAGSLGGSQPSLSRVGAGDGIGAVEERLDPTALLDPVDTPFDLIELCNRAVAQIGYAAVHAFGEARDLAIV